MVAQHYRWDFIGLSTDTKPTPDTSERVVDGSTFYCSDTSKLYVFCKDTWYERKPLGSGGGGTTYTAGTGITIDDDTISVDDDVVATMEELNSRIVTGAGAPTTSTEGSVGALYEDNTNGKLYICTDDTDPYVWEEVGAGGGGVTPVQTKGTSTTDVMSQDATTKMIFPDVVNHPEKIAINGTVTPTSGVAINGNIASNRFTNIAISASSTLPATVGASARDDNIVIGTDAYTNQGTGNVSIGHSANSTGLTVSSNNVCIGSSATNSATDSSVALGYSATVTRTGEVNIGAGFSGSGYNSTNYRVLGGVHDGQLAQDAVTVAQVNNTIDAINTALSTNIPHIGASS